MAPQAASYGDLLLTSLVVLGVVSVVAYIAVRVLGRVLAGHGLRRNQGGMLGVLARLSLEPKRSLYVIEVAGKTLLVGTSEMGLTVLSELDREAVHASTVARPSFSNLVRTAWLARLGKRAPSNEEDSRETRPIDPRAGADP